MILKDKIKAINEREDYENKYICSLGTTSLNRLNEKMNSYGKDMYETYQQIVTIIDTIIKKLIVLLSCRDRTTNSNVCFVSGYQHRLTYFICTIPEMEKYLQPLEEVIRHKFIVSITGGHLMSDLERDLMELPPSLARSDGVTTQFSEI